VILRKVGKVGMLAGVAVIVALVGLATLRPGVIDSDMWSFLDEGGREKLRQSAGDVSRTQDRDRRGRRTRGRVLLTNPYVTGAVLEISGGETLVQLDIGGG
jgi:hypothetical protein